MSPFCVRITAFPPLRSVEHSAVQQCDSFYPKNDKWINMFLPVVTRAAPRAFFHVKDTRCCFSCWSFHLFFSFKSRFNHPVSDNTNMQALVYVINVYHPHFTIKTNWILSKFRTFVLLPPLNQKLAGLFLLYFYFFMFCILLLYNFHVFMENILKNTSNSVFER